MIAAFAAGIAPPFSCGGQPSIAPGWGMRRGRGVHPGRCGNATRSPSAAVAAVLEAVVPTMVAGRCMRPALVMGALEVMPTLMVAGPEMPRLVVRPVMPPRRRGIVLEPGRPGLRSEVPARRMSMIHELRAVMQDDAEIERGHHIPVNRGVPVGGCRRRHDGPGAKRGSEQKMLVHGLPPKCSQA